MDYSDTLEPSLWFWRIEKIANGDLGRVENSLRHAAHLLQLTPTPLQPQVRLAIDEDTFETLLESGDFDTAAKHLVTQPTVLDIEPGEGTKTVSARIKCSVSNRNIDGCGDTVATAILDAWTTRLLALRTKCGANVVRPVNSRTRPNPNGIGNRPRLRILH